MTIVSQLSGVCGELGSCGKRRRGLLSLARVGGLAILATVGLVHSGVGAVPPAPIAIGNVKSISIEDADRVLRAFTPAVGKTQINQPLNAVGHQLAPSAGGSANSTPTCSNTSAEPLEIITLAASLKCDIDLIFEYVYNNTEYEPLFGSNKGVLGTLLDHRGSDIDQANLFIALLTAAGIPSSQINMQYGYIRVTSATAPAWLGVKNDALAISELLATGGTPLSNFQISPDGSFSLDVAHVWVQVKINGTFYAFDPSFKQHAVSAGYVNLPSVMGYTKSGFLADAGGTITSSSITGLNRGNIRGDLLRYANNLAAYIAANGSAWSVADAVGGKRIVYLTGSPLRNTVLPNLSPSQSAGFPQSWGVVVPNAYRTCFTISMPGVTQTDCSGPSSQTIQLYSDTTYDHRITVFSSASGANFTPTLLIDGVPPPNGQNTGTAQPPAQLWEINVAITHPTASPTLSAVNQVGTLSVSPGGSYVISSGWGQVDRGTVDKHRTLLAQSRSSGASGASEPVLGETLASIGYSWIAENCSSQRLVDNIAKTTTLYYHSVGIAGQTAVQGQSSTQGPYVDLPLNEVSPVPQTYQGSSGFPPLEISTFLALSGLSSSLESAVLEQTQGLVPGMTAASTIRLFDLNVAAGSTTYFADGTTTAGLSNYFSAIRPNLSSYSAADLSKIDGAISSDGTSTGSPTGKQVLAPGNGMQNVGIWKGAGYTIFNQTSTAISVQQLISGGLSGGFSGTNVPTTVPANSPDPTISSSTAATTQAPAATISADVSAQPHASNNSLISEPVDAITGAYLYTITDLLLGNGPPPFATPFGRTYSSAASMTDVGLGNGWTSTYSITAARSSDPYPGLGEGSATNSASAIAALYVLEDLLTPPTLTVQNLTLAWVVSRWMTDQVTNNAVLVSQPGTNEEFIATPRPDNATSVNYTAPLGSAAALTGAIPDSYGNPTTFSYIGQDSRRLTFNPIDVTNTGSLSAFALPAGTTLSFNYGYTYNGLSYLTGVSSNLGRTLSLAWSGPHLSSVSDGTGRSVSYGYDTNANLVTASDPLGQITRFAYDGASHLTQIYYPALPSTAFVTNTFDGVGRVNGQANANGAFTTFYFAGARTETSDPVGNRHVTYQTRTGRVIQDIAILNAAIGDVFSDTAQQSGLVVRSNLYDGQDRISLSTSPEGGTTSYTYSPDFRQNLIQLTVTPKPGSGLAPLTTTSTYDAIYNKPTSFTDPLGLVTTMTYDPPTGNVLNMVRDAGASPHFNAASRFTYDIHGLLLASTDPLGVVTQRSYDNHGNPLSIVRDAGGLRQASGFTYDAVGNALTQTDPRGATSSSTYDAGRRRLTVTAPSAGGSPSLVTATAYDANGNPTQSQQSSGGTTLLTSSQTYTSTGKVSFARDANGNVTQYAYDGADRLTRVTDAVGRVTIYAYDALSRQVSVSNPAIQATPLQAVQYTPDGLKASLTDARGNVLAYAFDGFDRLSMTTYPATAAVAATTEAYTHDADGNVLTRQTRKGDTISFAYDTLNRLTTKTEPSSTPSVTYGYDLAGRVISVSDNGPSLVAVGQTATFTNTAVYDALNRPVSLIWTPAAAQTAPASAASVAFAHRYDQTNLRIGQAANDNTWLAYPGPASTTAYTPNALNQYGQVGSATPTYDANGNLTFDGTFTYSYDAESRLVSIAQSGTSIATYAYDGRGRRKSRAAGGVTTIYVTGAEDQELLEYDGGSGAVAAAYAYNLGGGIDDVLNRVAPGGARQTLVPDIQGSIIASLDSGGTLTKIAYQAFGESASAVASGTGPRYTGRRLDPETAAAGGAQSSGLYYYRARTYSPVLGRFLQADPIGILGGVNLYAYVQNDPLNGTDPLGLETYYFQLGAGLTGLLGYNGGVGIYYTTNTGGGPDIGVFSSGGPAVGANIGLSAVAGYTTGNLSNFQGRSLSVDASALIFAGGATFGATGNAAQTARNATGGYFGLSLSPTVAGGDVSALNTQTFGLFENFVDPIASAVFNSLFGTPSSSRK